MRELALGAALLIASGSFLLLGAKRVGAKAELKLETLPAQIQDESIQPHKRKRIRVAVKGVRYIRDFNFWEPHIIACESRGNPVADNPSPKSTASGLYAITDSTWSGHGEYDRAKDAPVEIQREKAKLLFDSSGLRPWFADSRAKACILGRAS